MLEINWQSKPQTKLFYSFSFTWAKPFNRKQSTQNGDVGKEFNVTSIMTCCNLILRGNGKTFQQNNKERFSCTLSNSAIMMFEPCSSPDYLKLLRNKGFRGITSRFCLKCRPNISELTSIPTKIREIEVNYSFNFAYQKQNSKVIPSNEGGGGHSIITFALSERGVHQNANQCHHGREGSCVNANVCIFFSIVHLVQKLLRIIIRIFVSFIKTVTTQ